MISKSLGILGACLTIGLITAAPVQADNFTFRIAAGHPAAPLSTVNQLQKTFVPNVTKRVAAETPAVQPTIELAPRSSMTGSNPVVILSYA